jgi:hypothetical protein
MTGDGVEPPRMRVPVTVMVCRFVATGVSVAFSESALAGVSLACAPRCASVSAVASWALANAVEPVAAANKAMEIALHNVLVFMLRPLLSPEWALLARRHGGVPVPARSSGCLACV